MLSIDNKELFEKYYQAEYDFNTSSLTDEEIDEIKELVKEKRVHYALAPIGTQIFSWITEQKQNIHFELVDFESEKIDGMLYVPVTGSECAYIVLNSKKSLSNQIFTVAHEYYHYVKDYLKIKSRPYICDFRELQNVSEKKASRFAAEFLLPEEALRYEMKLYRKQLKASGQTELSFAEYAAIVIYLTLKYQMPLKAVIYRLYEEKYIDDIKLYIENYDFLRNFLLEVNFIKEKMDYLYSNNNPYLDENRIIYRQMKNAYSRGYATREEILRDAQTLNLKEAIIQGFFDIIKDDDEGDDDEEMLAYISKIMEGK